MTANHEALVNDWRKNAARQEERNFRFLHSLKVVSDPDQIDSLAHELHEEVFHQIDCTHCAHCCQTMTVAVTDEDIERLSKHLGLTAPAFIAAYLEPDSDEGGLRIKAIPCPFLGTDDLCTIYDVRPKACREYPHTDKEDFARRSYLHTANTLSCPAVYHIVKRLRQRLRHGLD